MTPPPDLRRTWAVFSPGRALDTLDVTDDVYERLEQDYQGFHGHALVALHEFSEDWPTWEIHPDGDELVVLLSGAAEFVLREGGGDRTVALSEPGTFVVVPRSTWHTARVRQPTAMLFLTPGAGTRNAETPDTSA